MAKQFYRAEVSSLIDLGISLAHLDLPFPLKRITYEDDEARFIRFGIELGRGGFKRLLYTDEEREEV